MRDYKKCYDILVISYNHLVEGYSKLKKKNTEILDLIHQMDNEWLEWNKLAQRLPTPNLLEVMETLIEKRKEFLENE